MVDNVITQIWQRQAEQASTLIVFSNKSSKLWNNTFIGLKHQFVTLFTQKRADVEKLAEALLEREDLFQSDVEALIGPRPFEDKHLLDVEPNEKHPEGGISEGVPPYDPNVTNQAPAAKWATHRQKITY